MLRILPAAAVLVVVAAGCGGAAEPQRSAFHGVPPALARDWEGQANAIAAAAAAGNDCKARDLAKSLQAEVVNSEHKVPLRLRKPLNVGVNALVGRITCTPVVPTPPKKPTPPKEPKPPKDHHEKHGHHGHGDGGDEH